MRAADDIRIEIDAYLRRLPADARRRLAGEFGIGADEKDRAQFVDRVRNADARIAASLLDGLPDAGREVAIVAALAGEERVGALAALAAKWFASGTETARRGLDEIAERGLSGPGLSGATLVPGLAAKLRSAAWTSFAAGLSHAGERPPRRFVLACAAALALADPPRILKGGGLAQRWLRSAVERFGASAPAAAGVASLLDDLILLGVVDLPFGTEGDRATVQTEGLAAFRLTDETLALATLENDLSHRPRRVVLASIAAAAGPDGWTDAEAVPAAASRMHRPARASGWEWSSTPAPHETTASAVLCALRRLAEDGMVQVRSAGGRVQVRPAPEVPRDGLWIVQPSFEMIVPAETPPERVALLGTFADLVRVDHVATFRISRTSVERLALHGELVPDAVAFLAGGSRTPIPQNVAVEIAGWARRAAPLRCHRGATLVAGSDEHAAFLRSHEHLTAEIAPGVFLFTGARVNVVLRQAEKRGFAVADRAADEPEDPRYDEDSPVERADHVRSEIDRWRALAAEPEDPPDDDRAAADTERLARHPLIREAAEGQPNRLAAAASLSESQLTHLERSFSLPTLRAALAILAKRHAMGAPVERALVDMGVAAPAEAPAAPRKHRAAPAASAVARARPPKAPEPAAAPSAPAAVSRPAAPPRRDPSAETGWVQLPRDAVVARLRTAAATGAAIEVHYRGGGGDSVRVLHPLQVVEKGPRTFAVATADGLQGACAYLIDRIVAVRESVSA